jgi:hypothetical protein
VLLQLTPSASDPDGHKLTFSLVSPPSGATIDAATGLFKWTPDELQCPGLFTLTIRATDNGIPALNTDAGFAVAVSEVNTKPVLAEIGTKTVSPLSNLTFTASASDVDRPVNSLSFSLSNAPSGAGISATTGVFNGTPTASQVGTYTFNVNVTDNGIPPLIDSKPVTVTVLEQILPDLVMTSTKPEDASVKPGKKLKVSFTVLNQGSLLAQSSKVGFRLSKNTIYGDSDDIAISTTKSVPKLEPGAGSQADTEFEIPKTVPVGAYFVCTIADSANTVVERNETNNTLCSTSQFNVQ